MIFPSFFLEVEFFVDCFCLHLQRGGYLLDCLFRLGPYGWCFFHGGMRQSGDFLCYLKHSRILQCTSCQMLLRIFGFHHLLPSLRGGKGKSQRDEI